MKKKNAIILAATAAVGIYSVVNGKGIFNKFRFKSQHDAISRYVKSHYPYAVYSAITAAGNGWATVVRQAGKPKIFLYATRSADGVYIFNETQVKDK